jgi:uncharacterized glyoxalase superfamily protein PhnB
MAKKAKKKPKRVRAIPKGYQEVTPYLNVSDGSGFIAFTKAAFGAKVRSTMPGPEGKLMHAEIKIGDTIVMLSDAVREPARPAGLLLYSNNVDKSFAKAVKAGAKVLMPPQDMFWGDRFARVEDPQGNSWQIATHVEDVSPKEMKKRAAALAAEQAAGGGDAG